MINKASSLVSIIMPTYNRAHFIKIAFDSMRAQTYSNWELIIVDDGSSDNTEQLVNLEIANTSNSVVYLKQQNAGPAIARNTGIKQANGEFIAFFDSDDQWLPHHLADSIAAMQAHPQISWVYSACKRINTVTGDTLLPSTFYTQGKGNKLFSLKSKRIESLYIIDDKDAVVMQLMEGIDSGLQNSVIHSRVFAQLSLPPFRIGEDRLFIVMALKQGFTLAFIDNIHVLYNVHDGNTSDTVSNDERYDRRIDAMQRLLDSYEKTTEYVTLNKVELQTLHQRLALDYFWKLGFSLQWPSGNFEGAIHSYHKALRFYPYSLAMWKSYIVARVKMAIKTMKGR
jgi:glycosyltransferase involved in cell wall biosynthesis